MFCGSVRAIQAEVTLDKSNSKIIKWTLGAVEASTGQILERSSEVSVLYRSRLIWSQGDSWVFLSTSTSGKSPNNDWKSLSGHCRAGGESPRVVWHSSLPFWFSCWANASLKRLYQRNASFLFLAAVSLLYPVTLVSMTGGVQVSWSPDWRHWWYQRGSCGWIVMTPARGIFLSMMHGDYERCQVVSGNKVQSCRGSHVHAVKWKPDLFLFHCLFHSPSEPCNLLQILGQPLFGCCFFEVPREQRRLL